MIAHLHDPERPLLGLCGSPLLGINAPPETPRCVVCLDLGDFREEHRRAAFLEALPVGGRAGGRSIYTSHPARP
jgi:hypothetical protein